MEGKNEAIKRIRQETGIGLRECHDLWIKHNGDVEACIAAVKRANQKIADGSYQSMLVVRGYFVIDSGFGEMNGFHLVMTDKMREYIMTNPNAKIKEVVFKEDADLLIAAA